MMQSTTAWTWRDSNPPGPQTADAGAIWSLTLPLQGSGQPPAITWLELPPRITVQPSPSEPLTFLFDLTAAQPGVYFLKFRCGTNALDDLILLKILPSTAASAPMSTCPLPGAPAASAPSFIPDDEKDAEDSAMPVPTPTAVLQRAGMRPATDGAATPAPIPSWEAPSELAPPAPAPCAAPLPPLVGDYVIAVFRGTTPLPQLTRALERHKSLLIGKFSASKAIFPDLDLRHHFADLASEANCSRQQARAYWNAAGRIVLHNLGKAPLTLVDGQLVVSGATCDWLPGMAVTLPGGLTLQLIAAAY